MGTKRKVGLTGKRTKGSVRLGYFEPDRSLPNFSLSSIIEGNRKTSGVKEYYYHYYFIHFLSI